MGARTGHDLRTVLALGGVAAAFGLTVVLATLHVGLETLPTAAVLGGQAVGVALALLAPRHPRAAFAACLGLSAVVPLGATPVAAFAVGRWRAPGRSTTALTVGGVVVLCALWLLEDRTIDVDRVVTYVTVTLLGWVMGAALHSSESAREAQTAREEVERAALADTVRQGERDRLAREMHDVVAHRISLMVLDANRIEAGSAPSPSAVAVQIRTTGQAALDDMREVLGRLRRVDLDDELSRQSLTEVESVVSDVRAVGQPIELRLHARSRQPPDLAERTAVRIVRESLTNAARHAPGAATVVQIEDAPGAMTVEIRNAAPEHAPAVALTTGGHGLAGMQERVELVGGEWACGPTETGGFLVRAVLPRGAR